MDYESERLDAYDASEAMRFVAGAVNREDPIEKDSEVTGLFDLDLINQQATALADSLVDGGTKVVLGGVRDAAQAALQGAGDLVESRAERYVDLGLLDQPDNPLELQVPVPRLPAVEEPKGFLGQMARDFVQFGTGYFFTPNKFGKFNPVIRSGIADAAYFDPAEGGFIRPLLRLEFLLPEAIEFLAVDDINEETRAAQRLTERAKLAGEGALAGSAITGIIATLGAIKRNPKLLRYAAAALAAGTGATIPQQAEAGAVKTFLKALTDTEIGLIQKQATKRGKLDEELAQNVQAEAVAIGLYPEEDGWLPITINPDGKALAFKVKKGGKIEIKWQQPAYAFHLPEKYQGTKNRPSPEETAAQKQKLAQGMLNDVNDVVDGRRQK